jgi:hypothetical protein
MPAYQLDQFLPDIDPSCWIAPCATIITNRPLPPPTEPGNDVSPILDRAAAVDSSTRRFALFAASLESAMARSGRACSRKARPLCPCSSDVSLFRY